jgi:hypothetical protein
MRSEARRFGILYLSFSYEDIFESRTRGNRVGEGGWGMGTFSQGGAMLCTPITKY